MIEVSFFSRQSLLVPKGFLFCSAADACFLKNIIVGYVLRDKYKLISGIFIREHAPKAFT